MKVQPTTSYLYNLPLQRTGNKKNYSSPSFKSIESFLIYLAAKEGISTIAGYKKYQYILALNEHVNGFFDEKIFPSLLQALSKTNNDFYKGSARFKFLAFMDNKKLDTIEALRWGALKNLRYHIIKDDTYTNIQTKKDFLMSFIDNFHPISPGLVSCFSNLNDKIYGTYKAEFVDKVLFSPKYNKNRANLKVPGNSDYFDYQYKPELVKYRDEYAWVPTEMAHVFGEYIPDPRLDNSKYTLPSMCYQNLKLIESLDKNLYGAFLAKRRGVIEKAKQVIEEAMNKEKDHAHFYQMQQCISTERDFYENLIHI